MTLNFMFYATYSSKDVIEIIFVTLVITFRISLCTKFYYICKIELTKSWYAKYEDIIQLAALKFQYISG